MVSTARGRYVKGFLDEKNKTGNRGGTWFVL